MLGKRGCPLLNVKSVPPFGEQNRLKSFRAPYVPTYGVTKTRFFWLENISRHHGGLFFHYLDEKIVVSNKDTLLID